MKQSTLIFLFLSVAVGNITAQSDRNPEYKDLLFYGDIMMNAMEPAHRERAFQRFYPLFTAALTQQGSFDQTFDELRWISKKFSEDKSFRIFTWYVQVSDDDYRYHGIIQKRDGTVFSLTDVFKNSEDSDTEEFNAESWLGAIYYNIMDIVEPDGTKYYILFGINKWNRFENIKIADILFFPGGGNPVFGKEVFYFKDRDGDLKKLNRIIMRYSADAMVSLNYNPDLNMIVMDHLIPRMGRGAGQDLTMVPDGSYSGYIQESGIWKYVDKLHTEVLDEAPRPKPVMESRKGNNIFGKQKKQ
jgi:hypothetical protein